MLKVITSTELQKQTHEPIDYARIERDAVIVETYTDGGYSVLR